MDEAFEVFLEDFGPQFSEKKLDKDQVAKLSGAIPDNLLHYLSEYGSGGFANGLLWLADPSSFRYPIAAWLSQTSIENPADFHVVSRTHLDRCIYGPRKTARVSALTR
jgi:hypothetical protein